MGAYLSTPITTKETEEDEDTYIRVASASMQGWRMSQEDAHNAILEFDTNSSLFAVYDGHGGHEVAVYTAKHLPNFIKNNSLYLKGQMDEAMVESFVEFDRTITSPKVVSELRKIAGTKASDEEDEERDPQELSHLCEEASMPIEAVLTKYVTGEEEGEAAEATKAKNEGSSSSKPPSNPAVAALQKGAAGGSKPISPFLRAKPSTEGGVKGEGEGAKQTLDFKEETSTNGKEVKKEEEEGEKVVKEETKEEEKNGSGGGANSQEDLTKIKVKDEEDSKEPVLVNGTNGHHEESGEAAVTNGSSDVKGKGKGKGKGKSSSVVRPKGEKGEEPEEEDEEKTNQQQQKKASPKKSAEELYKGLLSESPEDEMDSEDEDEDGAFGNSDDDDDTEDTDDGEDEDEESDSEDLDDDDDDDDGFLCGAGRDYAEMPGNDSGCTAVVAVLRGTTLYVANAGDSRCVVCRDGQAVEMSFDHKPEDEPEMKRIEAAGGKVTPDGRVNGGLNLSRAIGDHTYKTNKSLPLTEQMISPVPDVRTLQLDAKRDSFILLACDGIWNSLSSQETVDFVQQRLMKLENEAKKDPSTQQLTKICEELFDYCLAPDTVGDGTGCDNMTAVLVKLRPAFENKPETTPQPSDTPPSSSTETPAATKSSEEGGSTSGAAAAAETAAETAGKREATEGQGGEPAKKLKVDKDKSPPPPDGSTTS